MGSLATWKPYSTNTAYQLHPTVEFGDTLILYFCFPWIFFADRAGFLFNGRHDLIWLRPAIAVESSWSLSHGRGVSQSCFGCQRATGTHVGNYEIGSLRVVCSLVQQVVQFFWACVCVRCPGLPAARPLPQERPNKQRKPKLTPVSSSSHSSSQPRRMLLDTRTWRLSSSRFETSQRQSVEMNIWILFFHFVVNLANSLEQLSKHKHEERKQHSMWRWWWTGSGEQPVPLN